MTKAEFERKAASFVMDKAKTALSEMNNSKAAQTFLQVTKTAMGQKGYDAAHSLLLLLFMRYPSMTEKEVVERICKDVCGMSVEEIANLK